MWKASFRSLLERKVRLALTVVSIMLGVGFVAGTYIFTDSIGQGFQEIFSKAIAGFDVQVRKRPLVEGGESSPLPESLLEQVRMVNGVQAAAGTINDTAPILDKKGKPIGSQGPPALAGSYSPIPELSNLEVKQGRLPKRLGEAAMDDTTAAEHGFRVGNKVGAVVRGAKKEFDLVGIVGVKGLANLGGATLLVFDLQSAQRLFDKQAVFDAIEVKGVSRISQAELGRRIARAIPDQYEVVPRNVLLDEALKQIKQGVSFITAALLPFGFVGLFVGGFLIFNTFSILFAQRVREFALMRAVGAQPSQVLRTVLAEALAIGSFASVAGLVMGVALVTGLKALFGALKIELPSSGTPIAPRTVVISLIVGVQVTLVSALFPAIRARRLSVITALKEGAVLSTPASRRRRYVAGAILCGLGVALMLLGVFGGRRGALGAGRVLQLLGAGAVMLFLGVAFLSPLLVRPLARFIGWPIGKVVGVPGKIARGNAMRDPSRTAATAAALMIGVALVTFVTAFATSAKASVARRVKERVKADFAVTFSGRAFLSPELARHLEELPEVSVASGARFGGYLLDGTFKGAIGIDPVRMDRLVFFDVKQGRLQDLGEGGIFVRKELADEKHWKVGSLVSARFPKGDAQQLTIRGIFAGGPTIRVGGRGGSFASDTLIGLDQFQQRFVEQNEFAVYGAFASGTRPSAGKAAVEKVLQDYPTARFYDQAGLRKRSEDQINRVLALVNALLGLALVIALFGIVNTLALSTFERVREIGLMRAVGVTRRQIRAIVRWESVIIAVIGAILGIGVGILFFYLLIVQRQPNSGLQIVLPTGRLISYVVIAGLAGIAAAVFPARRAARLDVLKAIAYE